MPSHTRQVELPPGARTVLSGPDLVARTLASRESDPQRKWLLRRPKAVRRSFLATVIDDGGDEERWMLLADDATRSSYLDEVGADAQTRWILGQPEAVRRSYVAEVLDAR
jgi:hypothetical protein